MDEYEDFDDSSDKELQKFTEDSNDADFVPPSGKTKTRRTRKSTAGARKIQHEWTPAQIVTLIAAVEKRRMLWDFGSEEYKLSKVDSWREVCDELGFEIDSNEVKTKWSSLRVTFKTNLANLRKKKSGQSADDSSTVSWRYFKQMLFLEANDANQSTQSTSTMELVIFLSFVVLS